MTGTRYFAEAAYAPDPLGYWVIRDGESRQPLFLVRFSDFGVEFRDVARSIAALLNCCEETTCKEPKMSNHDVVDIITNLLDTTAAATSRTRRTKEQIDDARVMLDDLASGLPPADRERFWRAILGTASSRLRSATDHHKPLAWAGRGCERDIEERRIEEADAEEAAREQRGFTRDDAEHLDQQPEDAQ